MLIRMFVYGKTRFEERGGKVRARAWGLMREDCRNNKVQYESEVINVAKISKFQEEIDSVRSVTPTPRRSAATRNIKIFKGFSTRSIQHGHPLCFQESNPGKLPNNKSDYNNEE